MKMELSVKRSKGACALADSIMLVMWASVMNVDASNAVHGAQSAGCNCSPTTVSSHMVFMSSFPYFMVMPSTTISGCKNNHRTSGVKNCEVSAYDTHYSYLCSYEEQYWNCVAGIVESCGQAAGVGAGGGAAGLLGAAKEEKNWNLTKVKVQIPWRVLAGAATGWTFCWATKYADGTTEIDDCARAWAASVGNEWDNMYRSLEWIRNSVNSASGSHDCSSD